MPTRGIRGAITVTEDTKEKVLTATTEMLVAIRDVNPTIRAEDIASALFTVTNDIRSAFPAVAVANLGWESVPRTCAQEIPVEGSLPLCIRVLIHWNTDLPQSAIKHIYLREAKKLRPDIAK